MTDHDHVAELFNRTREKMRRGEELGLESELDYYGLTGEERAVYIALADQAAAAGEEQLEALDENIRILSVLVDLIAVSSAPPGTTLGQALDAGYVTVLEAVESVRGAVPDPLAEQAPPK